MDVADYAWSAPDLKALRAAGVVGVVRYLSHDPTKDITHDEAQRVFDAGLSLNLVWETYPMRLLEGYGAGSADAAEAMSRAPQFGWAPGRAMYFAVDMPVSLSQMSAVLSYVDGVRSVFAWDETGVYGTYATLSTVRSVGRAKWLWQTSAWSAGAVADGIALYQDRYDVNIGGGLVDLSRVETPNYGGWFGWNGETTMTQGFGASDPNFEDDTAWRVSGLSHGSDTIEGGRFAGENVWPVQQLKAVLTQCQSNGTALSTLLGRSVDANALAQALRDSGFAADVAREIIAQLRPAT